MTLDDRLRRATPGASPTTPGRTAAPSNALTLEQVVAARYEVELLIAATDSDYEPQRARPTMRGRLHLFAFGLSIAMAAVLIPLAAVQSGKAALAVSVYCLFMSAMFGTSALYHRRQWGTRGWQVMKRLDHTMIFLFIAGSYTPFGLLALASPARWWVLGIVWSGCTAGVVLKLFWPKAPRWVGVPIYLAVSWVLIFVLPAVTINGGVTALVLMLTGGLLYSVGGIFYALHWPNPRPGVFGYHEVFHAMTVLAAVLHYISIFMVVYNSPLV